MILLSAQHIQKSFGGNTVLRDASLVLQDGQRLGLVGVNGSGKSTLMKIIAWNPTTGAPCPCKRACAWATWPSRAW